MVTNLPFSSIPVVVRSTDMQGEFQLIFRMHCLSNSANVFDHNASFDLLAVDVVNCIVGDCNKPHLRHAPRISLLDVVCVNKSV